MRGIYCYIDKTNDSIIYIGKDSRIDKQRRHKDHYMPHAYNLQKINQVLQNNPERYIYKVLKSWDETQFHDKLANLLEMLYIKRYNPKFNFTKGGEGIIGFRHSEETKIRLSNHFKGKKLSDETKKKMSDSRKGASFSEEHKQNLSKSRKGMKFTQAHKDNISKNHADFSGKNHPQSKYTLWDNTKCHYQKYAVYHGNRDVSNPCRCFSLKYHTKVINIGLNFDFVSCELINQLIEEFTM